MAKHEIKEDHRPNGPVVCSCGWTNTDFDAHLIDMYHAAEQQDAKDKELADAKAWNGK